MAALSTGHKVGLGLVGLAFVVFALISAFLLPALRPEYPGRRGLPVFLTFSATLFVGMMFAVFFFGRETSESHAAEASKAASTTTPTQTTAPSTAAPSPTKSTTTAPAASGPTAAPTGPKGGPVTEAELKKARVAGLQARRRGRDLNPRRTFRPVRDFQSRSLDRSDTSPGPQQSTRAGIRRPHGQSPHGLQTAPASGAFGPLGHLSGPGAEYPAGN